MVRTTWRQGFSALRWPVFAGAAVGAWVAFSACSQGTTDTVQRTTVAATAVVTASVVPTVSGTATVSEAGGVMAEDASVDLGRVPLDTMIQHRFVLQNVGTAPANLGPAQIEVLEGC